MTTGSARKAPRTPLILSLKYVRSRLARLAGGADHVERQYLYRFQLPSVTSGNRTKVFALGAKGRDYQADDLAWPVEWYHRPSKLRHLGYSHLTHALLVTRILVSGHVWNRQESAYTLVDTRISYELARDRRLSVIPDLWELWERSKDRKKFPLWIEDDNSSEFSVKWKQYLQGRVTFIKSGEYAREF